jgi:putative acyl-CoA dehydrogenase
MGAVLADMALEVEGAVAFVMRLARALDCAADDPREAAYARLMTPTAKYWICKLAPAFIYEAMECLGGNGYVEESMLPRLYREAPVNAIWEGSGNVMCLDVLRALKRQEEADLVAALAREVPAPGFEVADFKPEGEANARAVVGKLAVLASAVAIGESAPAAVAEAFVRTRLVGAHGALYGGDAVDGALAQELLQRVLAES